MALNQQTLEGRWNEIKGKLHEKWGELNEDELQRARGNVDQLVGTIQRRTGETRESIQNYLEEVTSGAAASARQAAEKMRGYAGQAAESLHGAQESMQAGFHQAQEMIRYRPLESVLTCFGIGVVTGVVFGLMLRSR